jgi:hypothetical protein
MKYWPSSLPNELAVLRQLRAHLLDRDVLGEAVRTVAAGEEHLRHPAGSEPREQPVLPEHDRLLGVAARGHHSMIPGSPAQPPSARVPRAQPDSRWLVFGPTAGCEECSESLRMSRSEGL